jgi:DNA-directed RNA polymerase subunit RPC12/RpoP
MTKSWGICVECGHRAYEKEIENDSGYFCKYCKKFVQVETNPRDWKWKK